MKKMLLVLLILLSGLKAGDKAFADTVKNSGEFLQWQFKLGADERLRYEYRQEFDLDRSRQDMGNLFFHRLKLNATATFSDEYLNDVLTVFVEGLDAQTWGYQLKAQANQVDDFDFHQGYVTINNIAGSDLDFTAGRKELKYGNGRLIAQPSWSNRVRSFDAGVLHYDHAGWWGDLLYAQDVKHDDNNFNFSYDGEFVSGFYGGYQKDKVSPLFETYFLTQVIGKTPVTSHRYTVGGRFQSQIWSHALLEIEAPWQFGDTGTQDIRAYAWNVSLSKSFDEAFLKPKVNFEYNVASGDKSPTDTESNTFMPLYQTTHDPYGLIDLFRWQNMREVATGVDLLPTEKFKLRPQVNFFWLESKFDPWVNSSGTTVRSKTGGNREYYVGNEASLRAYYDVTKNIKWETGYAHFFTGEYIEDSGADDDVDWAYTQVTFKY